MLQGARPPSSQCTPSSFLGGQSLWRPVLTQAVARERSAPPLGPAAQGPGRLPLSRRLSIHTCTEDTCTSSHHRAAATRGQQRPPPASWPLGGPGHRDSNLHREDSPHPPTCRESKGFLQQRPGHCWDLLAVPAPWYLWDLPVSPAQVQALPSSPATCTCFLLPLSSCLTFLQPWVFPGTRHRGHGGPASRTCPEGPQAQTQAAP